MYKLSPSDFAYLYEDCKLCYWLRLTLDLHLVGASREHRTRSLAFRRRHIVCFKDGEPFAGL